MSLEAHPTARLFPLMPTEELEQLAADIKANGLREPITMHEGLVLDGRNRLRACELARVKPQFVEWQPNGSSPITYVLSMNLHRRHLTTAQRAAVAAELVPYFAEGAKERQREHKGTAPGKPGRHSPSNEGECSAEGEATQKAAGVMNVGRSSVERAVRVGKRSPELLDDVKAGELNLAEAHRRAGFAPDKHGRVGDSPSIHYGRGDKFRESIVPAVRYCKGWEKRGYEFPHVNPAEACRRLKILNELIPTLETVRENLERRSHKAKHTL